MPAIKKNKLAWMENIEVDTSNVVIYDSTICKRQPSAHFAVVKQTYFKYTLPSSSLSTLLSSMILSSSFFHSWARGSNYDPFQNEVKPMASKRYLVLLSQEIPSPLKGIRGVHGLHGGEHFFCHSSLSASRSD